MSGRVEPRPVQAVSVEVAAAQGGNGLMVIEAPMGEGKTEAALLATEVLAADAGASGLLFILPTQATSDAVFQRVLGWLARMPANSTESGHTVSLLHGRAGLSKAWGELPLSRGVGGVGVDDDTPAGTFQQIYVDPWTRGSKRAVLADFAVGTIDQLLFLALRTRHLALRHVGIASKVVVIDEVHAYDAYMDMYLTRALEWLGSYGVPVILLSATLTGRLRRRLIDAYRSGSRVGQASLAGDAPNAEDSELSLGYPLVVRASGTDVTAVQVEPSGRHLDVEIRPLDPQADELDAMCILLEETLRDGGCALVVRNTVARSIEAATVLMQRLPFEVRLIHSRFISDDRLAKETSLRTDFGSGRSAMVGKPGVVVSTQVVEQSLDVDFDILLSDVAPLDLLLQRIGRLHRHRETLPSESRCRSVRRPTVWLTGIRDWKQAPPLPDKGSESVYGLYPLMRTLAILGIPMAESTTISVPGDVRSLVEHAYGEEEVGPESWAQAMAEARVVENERLAAAEDRARSFRLGPPRSAPRSIVGWLDGAADDGESSVAGQRQVRDSEASVEVILLTCDSEGHYRPPSSAGGERRFLWDEIPRDDDLRALIGCTVRLPAWVVEGKLGDELIAEMEQRWYPAVWQDSPTLRGRLVMVLGVDGRQRCGAFEFSYNETRGLEVNRVS
jgi:CRISPR-associated helicase Cas3